MCGEKTTEKGEPDGVGETRLPDCSMNALEDALRLDCVVTVELQGFRDVGREGVEALVILLKSEGTLDVGA